MTSCQPWKLDPKSLKIIHSILFSSKIAYNFIWNDVIPSNLKPWKKTSNSVCLKCTYFTLSTAISNLQTLCTVKLWKRMSLWILDLQQWLMKKWLRKPYRISKELTNFVEIRWRSFWARRLWWKLICTSMMSRWLKIQSSTFKMR